MGRVNNEVKQCWLCGDIVPLTDKESEYVYLGYSISNVPKICERCRDVWKEILKEKEKGNNKK